MFSTLRRHIARLFRRSLPAAAQPPLTAFPTPNLPPPLRHALEQASGMDLSKARSRVLPPTDSGDRPGQSP